MLGAAPGWTSTASAETPIVAFAMDNVLTLNPAAITGRGTVQFLNNAYDALVELDPENRALQPRIAESWEVAQDNMSVTGC